jgi:hypothetical protein
MVASLIPAAQAQLGFGQGEERADRVGQGTNADPRWPTWIGAQDDRAKGLAALSRSTFLKPPALPVVL